MFKVPKIWFPIAVVALALLGTIAFSSPAERSFEVPYTLDAVVVNPSRDTVIYPTDGYKRFRRGTMEDVALSDSILRSLRGYYAVGDDEDDGPFISARDTIQVPDSLKYIDPFRYKYYVALCDSLTHVQVRDSLRREEASKKEAGDTLRARLDSTDWRKLDSLYAIDSTARAKAAFEKWYNGLSKTERKKYDYEQKMNRKMAAMDSLKAVKEEEKAVKDSIRESTPRILETFAIPDTMQYKRLINWTVDPDFQRLKVSEPDTSYNYYFYDYPFRRKDVQSSWLGVAGSPVQPYNVLKRDSDSDVDFYTPYESWTYTHRTLPMYNTKTPYTELAYWGTLLANDDLASDNLHILTTQNILPQLNFTILYDRWGGGGMLDNEETRNKTFAAYSNYLGKKYMMHVGYISNNISHEENGGVQDLTLIRDTTLEARNIGVMLSNASSKVKHKSVFLDQQYRIPFNFIEKIKARKDTSIVFNADSLNRDITTAFIGHSSEFNIYEHDYQDAISTTTGQEFYNNVFNYSESASADTLKIKELDNKVFLRLQPWSSDAIVSKLDVGLGYRLRSYTDSITTSSKTTQHSVYAYAGAEGSLRNNLFWDAKGKFAVGGYNAGDFDVSANAQLNFYPFRRARKSPLSLGAHFSTTLKEPNRYQQVLYSNHYSWENSFDKISTTRLSGSLSIPHWGVYADVGYSLLANNIYYDTLGIVRQNSNAMSILAANIRKDFVIGGWLHLDNSVLLQVSSNEDVLPVPLAAANLRWYAQFVLQRDATKTEKILEVQIGANVFYNTSWYAPAWNPNIGVFHNQTTNLYNNGPVIDVFINAQWKRACIFIKLENAGMGWPMEHADYFSADRYISTQRTVKMGICWPFYTQPSRKSSGISAPGANSAGSSSSSSSSAGKPTTSLRRN